MLSNLIAAALRVRETRFARNTHRKYLNYQKTLSLRGLQLRHVAGKCIVRCPIRYRQLVAENVCTGSGGSYTKLFILSNECLNGKL